MRRALHSFIIALLCLTLGIDSAKACWLWRHRCRPAVCRSAARQPVAVLPAHECPVQAEQVDWAAMPSADAAPVACCGAETAAAAMAPIESDAIETSGSACQVECCHEADTAGGVVTETADFAMSERRVPETAAAAPPRDEPSVVVHAPTVVVDAAPARPTAATQDLLPVPQPAPAPTSVVKPASGEQPAAEPAVAPTAERTPEQPEDPSAEPLVMPTLPPAPVEAAPSIPPPAASLAVTPPPRTNLFDEYDDVDEPAIAPAEPAAAPAVAPEEPSPAAAPDMQEKEPPAAESDQPAGDAVPPAAEPVPPAAEKPVAEPVEADAAPVPDAGAADDATAQDVPDEPQRLWTDASGSHQARGWLVAVDVDCVRILKANGRHTTVAIDMLSATDRDYVADVVARLAAARPAVPGPRETAGL